MIREREWGPNHPGVSSTLIDVALLQQIRGDRAEAAGPRARALAILSRTSLEAERQYRRTLAVMENVMGRAHPSVARALYDLAALEESAEHYTEAEPLAARALEILQEALGSDHLYLAAGLENQAALLRKLRRDRQAQTLEARAQAIRAHHAQQGGGR